jgi:serine protease Do
MPMSNRMCRKTSGQFNRTINKGTEMKTLTTMQRVGLLWLPVWLVAAGWTSQSAVAAAAVKANEVPALTSAVTAPALELSRAFAAVAAHVKPAVVSVFSEKILKFRGYETPFPFGDDFFDQFFGQGRPRVVPRVREYRIPQHGMGSGMILDKKGHILTNCHVVKDVDEIKIQLADKRVFEADIVGTDPQSDLAVIRIKGPIPPDLPTVELGDSEAVMCGDLVMAVGAPFGFAQTVTTGIISAKGRNMGIVAYEDFLQTDASINPGNSGGPLVNMRGEVIGMNTALASGIGQSAGVGFAIPIDMIKSALPVLLKGAAVQRGLLGVMIQDLDENLAAQFRLADTKGALVAQVNDGSPAAKTGIKVGDVIVRFAGKSVDSSSQLRNLVAATAPGARVEIVLLRNGLEQKVTATIGSLGADKSPGAAQEDDGLITFGLTVEELTPGLAQHYDLGKARGLVVTAVAADSPAALAGLQEGDLITTVNRENVASRDDVRRSMGKAQDKRNVLLLVNRKGTSLFVVLQRL